MSRDTHARNQLCRWAEILVKRGISTPETGCLSLRVGERMVISPEEIPLSGLAPDDAAIVLLKSCTPISGRRPDHRFPLHAAVYRKRNDFSALLHTDSLSVMTASRAGKTVPPLLDDMAQIIGVTVNVAENRPYQGGRPVIAALKRRNAVLLEQAGALCGAGSVEDAVAVAQVLEKGCKAFIESHFMGGGIVINRFEALLMRWMYLFRYSKKNARNRYKHQRIQTGPR